MKDQIKADLIQALKAKDEIVVSTLRLLLSEIHNQEIDKGGPLEESDLNTILQREVKKRREAIEAYQKGGRDELVAKEKKELKVLGKYQPQQLDSQEIEKIVVGVVKESGAKGPADFGKVMGMTMGKVKGQADGQIVGEVVKKVLGN